MPIFRICVINEDFTASEERDLPNEEAAWREALKGAIAMGSDQLCGDGPMLFGAEVSVTEDDLPSKRFVVTVGATRLSGGH